MTAIRSRHRTTPASGWRGVPVLILVALAFHGLALAAEAGRGHGHLSLDYQYISVDGFESAIGELPIGTTDTHTLNLEFEYKLSRRWTVAAGLPFIKKRYQGTAVHDPQALDPPRNATFIDDGNYHSSFQDFHFGARYLLKTQPVTIEPFLFVGVPSNDYPFFAHAAVGQNIWKVYVGSSFTYSPPVSDFYFRLSPSYVFVEETLGVSIDHWLINGEVGYFVTPGLAAKLFFVLKDGDGLEFPADFPTPRTGEQWFQHDRLLKHSFIHAGLGVDIAMDGDNTLSVSALTNLHSDQVHIVRYAVTLGISHAF